MNNFFKKNILKLKSELYYLKFFIFYELKYHLFKPLNLGINKKKRKIPIILNTTTTKERFHLIHIGLISMLNQDFKPDRFILWLPDELTLKDVPSKIKSLKKYGLEIKFVKDIGPHTKIYYGFKNFYDSILVSGDCDTIYSKNWLKDFYETSLKNKKSIICYRGSNMKSGNKFINLNYNSWKEEFPSNPCGKYIFPKSVDGMLYPPRCFDKELVLSMNIINQSPRNDDIWIKALSLYQNIEITLVNSKIKYFPPVYGTEKTALAITNVGKNKNDLQLKQIFDYLELDKKINYRS